MVNRQPVFNAPILVPPVLVILSVYHVKILKIGYQILIAVALLVVLKLDKIANNVYIRVATVQVLSSVPHAKILRIECQVLIVVV